MEEAADTNIKTAIKEDKELVNNEITDIAIQADNVIEPTPVNAMKPDKFGRIARKEMQPPQLEGQGQVIGVPLHWKHWRSYQQGQGLVN